MSNFGTAIKATETALNSAGSAMQENIAFMSGLEAQSNLLSATFQNLANDVIPKELVTNGLNVLNKALEILDTDLGVIFTRITLLTGIGWGMSSLLNASGILSGVISQFKTFTNVITGASTAFTGFHSIALPVIGIITTLSTVIVAVAKHIKEQNKEVIEAQKVVKEYDSEIKNIIDNQTKEISSIQSAITVTQAYISRLEQLDSKTNKTNQEQSEYHSILEKIVHVMPSVAGSINLQTNEIVGGTKALKEQIEAWKDLAIAQAYQDSLTDVYKKQADAQLKYQEQLDKVNELQEQRNEIIMQGQAGEKLITAYRAGTVSESEFAALSIGLPSLGKVRSTVNNLDKEITKAQNGLEVYAKGLKEVSDNASKTEAALSALMSTPTVQAATLAEQREKAAEYNKAVYYANLNRSQPTAGAFSKVKETEKATKQTGFNLQTIISLSESYIDLLESEYSLLEAQGASEEELKLKANEIKDNMHLQAEFLREVIKNGKEYKLTDEDIYEIQTKINNRSADWWTWNNKNKEVAKETAEIFEHVTDEYEKLIELSNEQLSEQKDAISALQSGMVDYYQEQINDIDKQIEALRNANEEINTQIELQEKLDSLAKAKQKKVLVYSNGSWNYVSDTDAVSTASKELDTYKRQRQLEENISALEDEKTILEQVQSSWENLTSDYEKLQNDWLINQRLGIDTTRENWQTLVADARTYATQYMGIMSALAQVSGLSVSGLDYDPTVDYSALMLSASSYEEALKWGAYREAKIVGEQLTPTKSSQDFLNEWKNKIAASRWNRMYSSNLPSYNSVAQKLSSGSGISSTGGNMQSLSLPRKEKLPYIQSLGNQMAVTIQALNLPNVTKGQEFAEYVKTHMFGQVMQLVH